MATTSQSQGLSERVEPEAFSQRVSSALGAAGGDVEVSYGQVIVRLERDRVVDAISVLKTDPQLLCDYFTFLSAVDWEDKGFEVLIAVYSLRYENTVIAKIALPREDPRLPTVTSVYRGANWHEREAAEMFGITFEGHPNPTALYLAEDFEGHPLRKDFKLASRTYKDWPGAREPEEEK